MSKLFGKTWWGEQWLNSLAHIDYNNRLPRGNTYARRGAVKSIEIEQNTIRAKVQGSRKKPYEVTIIVPPFFHQHTDRFIKAVATKPIVISKLLNRELDPEVLQIAEQHGLQIFPRQWHDFKMVCSCPDWAVPCKHLAAVIYKVSAEIDNNPFLVFDLHNLNLIEALKKEKISVSLAHFNIPLLRDVIDKNDFCIPQAPPSAAIDSFSQIDYSALYSISESLVLLLADAPVFYQDTGNFRDKYAMLLKRAERNAQRVLKGKTSLDAIANGDSNPMPEKPVKAAALKRSTSDAGNSTLTAIHSHTQLSVNLSNNYATEIYIDRKKTNLPLSKLLLKLSRVPLHLSGNYQPSVEISAHLLQLCLNLIANGAVIPQIVETDKDGYAVRWLPATICKEVGALMAQFQTLTDAHYANEQGKRFVNEALLLCSPFLSLLMSILTGKRSGDLFLDLFFKGMLYPFNAPGEEALPGGVHAWLQRYSIAKGKYKPTILVDELPDGRFRICANVVVKLRAIDKIVPLADLMQKPEYANQRYEVLQSLTHLTHFLPPLREVINSGGEQEIIYDIHQFTPFLMEIIPAIRLLDIDIFLPKSLQQLIKPKVSLRVKTKEDNGPSLLRLDQLLDYQWQVALGDTMVSQGEFEQLLCNSAGLIKFKSSYIYLSSGDFDKLKKQLASTKRLSPLEILRVVLAGEFNGAKIAIDNKVKALVETFTKQPEIPLPKGLRAQLRPYQQRGYSWLYRNAQIGFGSVIADDMGLGKTLQIIATLLKYKEEGRFAKEKALVVAPTGLLTNWMSEIERFAPSLEVKLYHGASRELNTNEAFDIVLTSYGTVRGDVNMLKKKKWQVVVIDEAQNIKNQSTAQSKAIKSLKAHTYMAMSGTPVENRLSELWSIMEFSNKGFLGSIADFKEQYANPIQNLNDAEAAHRLKRITAPFMMRRLKSDKSIISDLPDKIEIDSFGHLAKEQAALYQETLREAMRQIEGVEGTDHRSLFKRQGLVLQMILALKQICNHPTQFLKNKVMDATLSGKMELLFSKLDVIRETNEKVLIFTQFTEMGELMKQFIIERYDEEPMFYHGGCTIKQRQEMVDRFQHNRADRIFILSLKAAGTGLNLTAAAHVIHYDLWWNPAVEAQATDRAYRIGQKSNVMVHRFITKGTFEERINEMIQSKKALADMTVATGEGWIGNLNNHELKELFELK